MATYILKKDLPFAKAGTKIDEIRSSSGTEELFFIRIGKCQCQLPDSENIWDWIEEVKEETPIDKLIPILRQIVSDAANGIIYRKPEDCKTAFPVDKNCPDKKPHEQKIEEAARDARLSCYGILAGLSKEEVTIINSIRMARKAKRAYTISVRVDTSKDLEGEKN